MESSNHFKILNGILSMRNIWVILIIIILAGCVDKSTNIDESLQNLNVITNGGFEIIDSYINFAESWRVGSVPSHTFVEIDQMVSFEGDHSLHFYGLVEQYAFSSISTTIDADKIKPGEKYELSFWKDLISPSFFNKKLLKCPKCGTKDLATELVKNHSTND
jgi:hypothetical protein